MALSKSRKIRVFMVLPAGQEGDDVWISPGCVWNLDEITEQNVDFQYFPPEMNVLGVKWTRLSLGSVHPSMKRCEMARLRIGIPCITGKTIQQLMLNFWLDSLESAQNSSGSWELLKYNISIHVKHYHQSDRRFWCIKRRSEMSDSIAGRPPPPSAETNSSQWCSLTFSSCCSRLLHPWHSVAHSLNGAAGGEDNCHVHIRVITLTGDT